MFDEGRVVMKDESGRMKLTEKPWSARWEQGGSAEERYRCAAVFSGNQQFSTVQPV